MNNKKPRDPLFPKGFGETKNIKEQYKEEKLPKTYEEWLAKAKEYESKKNGVQRLEHIMMQWVWIFHQKIK